MITSARDADGDVRNAQKRIPAMFVQEDLHLPRLANVSMIVLEKITTKTLTMTFVSNALKDAQDANLTKSLLDPTASTVPRTSSSPPTTNALMNAIKLDLLTSSAKMESTTASMNATTSGEKTRDLAKRTSASDASLSIARHANSEKEKDLELTMRSVSTAKKTTT